MAKDKCQRSGPRRSMCQRVPLPEPLRRFIRSARNRTGYPCRLFLSTAFPDRRYLQTMLIRNFRSKLSMSSARSDVADQGIIPQFDLLSRLFGTIPPELLSHAAGDSIQFLDMRQYELFPFNILIVSIVSLRVSSYCRIGCFGSIVSLPVDRINLNDTQWQIDKIKFRISNHFIRHPRFQLIHYDENFFVPALNCEAE